MVQVAGSEVLGTMIDDFRVELEEVSSGMCRRWLNEIGAS